MSFEADNLLVFVTFSSDEDTVAWSSHCKRALDRLMPVNLDKVRRIRVLHALENFVDDGHRFFTAGVIARDDADVG